MAEDYLLAVRHAIRAHLKHDAGVTALIPAASVYGATVPAAKTWPFARNGTALASPFRASGLDSSAFRVSVQAFTKDLKDGAGAVTGYAEDQACLMGSAIKNALDDATIDIGGGMKARFAWIQSSPVMDPSESSAWMTTITFGVDVAG